MSGKEKRITGYCKYCDTQTNSVVKQYENGRLTWAGCPDCYVKKKRLENDTKQI